MTTPFDIFFVSSHTCCSLRHLDFIHLWEYYLSVKALTGLDRESAHPLQLHAVKRSWCTAANPGATGRLSWPVAPGFAAAQQLRFTVWSCNGWADSLSNPVKAFQTNVKVFCKESPYYLPFFKFLNKPLFLGWPIDYYSFVILNCTHHDHVISC